MHWSECGAAAPQHWEGASQSEEGASSLLGVGGSPLLTGSHLQLGGTLVPRSTRQCLPPPPQLIISCSPFIHSLHIV